MAKKESKSSNMSSFKLIGGWLMKKMAIGGAKQLRSNAEEVNKRNVFPVPDGDTGDNMRLTIESGIRALENLNSDNLATVMKTFLTVCFWAREETRALFFPSSLQAPQRVWKKWIPPTPQPLEGLGTRALSRRIPRS